MINSGNTQVVLLGKQIFDKSNRSISSYGHSITLTWKTSQVLRMLVESPDNMVSRKELIDVVWEGNFLVGNKGLTQAIWQLRKILETGVNGKTIETLPKKGYRLLLKITEQQNEFQLNENENNVIQWEPEEEQKISTLFALKAKYGTICGITIVLAFSLLISNFF